MSKVIGLDIGTSFLIASAKRGKKEIYNTMRDCYFVISGDNDKAIKFAQSAGVNFIRNEDTNEYYLIGQDALNFVNLLNTFMSKRDVDKNKEVQLKRPMAQGVLNPQDKLGSQMLTILVEGVVQGVQEGDEKGTIYYSVPANPVDSEFNTIFHSQKIKKNITKMGYKANELNEGLAVIYSEAPTTEVDGEDVPFTGIGLSMGGGMVNVCFAYRGMSMMEFSVSRSGDWIDEQVAQVTNTPIPIITKYKEEKLDFTENTDSDEILSALDIFYRNLVEYVIYHLKRELSGMNERITYEVPIVIAGGTSRPKGFKEMFEECIENEGVPFKVKEITLSKEPSYAVSRGCLLAALAEEDETEIISEEKSSSNKGDNDNLEEIFEDDKDLEAMLENL